MTADENAVDTPTYHPYADDTNGEEPRVPDSDDVDYDAFDKYLSAKVYLPKGDELSYGTVLRRKRTREGELVGKSNINPLLDTAVYDVEFDDGHIQSYSANIIAENLYSQVDEEGRHHLVLGEIIDHKSDATAVPDSDQYVTVNGTQKIRKTTRGWWLCVQWKDGSTSWERLADMKESHPVETAEYAVANMIDQRPAFAWWVPYTLRKRDRIIKSVSARMANTTQKFGIALPRTVQEALEIDRRTGTTFWRDAIAKEMKTVMPCFRFLDPNAADPVDHKWIKCHLIFDVKMDLTRKARFVAGGHMTDPPTVLTYCSNVSRESVRIAFLIAALNGLDVLSADITGAYLNAACKEKIWITCGPEFGTELCGRKAIIVRALYGLKSAGASCHEMLAHTLEHHLVFKPCRADQDVWYRRAKKPDGSEYYEYVLVYTDDMLVVSHAPKDVLNMVDQHYKLKPGSVMKPEIYLGAVLDFGISYDDGLPSLFAYGGGSATSFLSVCLPCTVSPKGRGGRDL